MLATIAFLEYLIGLLGDMFNNQRQGKKEMNDNNASVEMVNDKSIPDHLAKDDHGDSKDECYYFSLKAEDEHENDFSPVSLSGDSGTRGKAICRDSIPEYIPGSLDLLISLRY